MISQQELTLWGTWGAEPITQLLKGRSLTACLRFMREMQEALTKYSKTHAVDATQHRILSHIRLVEVACWRTYFRYEIKRRMKTEPNFLRLPYQKRKTLVRQDWEQLLRKYSY